MIFPLRCEAKALSLSGKNRIEGTFYFANLILKLLKDFLKNLPGQGTVFCYCYFYGNQKSTKRAHVSLFVSTALIKTRSEKNSWLRNPCFTYLQ